MHLTYFRALGTAVLLALTLPAASASAQNNVIVLGIRSIEGDDEFARNLTGALRHAAGQVEGWTVMDREVTLSQMALAHGCEEPDPPCLAQMAESLSADRVLYGEVRRTSGGDDYNFSVNLHLFNNENDQIEHSVTDTIPSVRRDIDDLRDVVRRYISELSGAPRVGTLRVSVNVPGAEVFVDDESVGVADSEGRLVVNDVAAGSREVRVVAQGHQSFRSTVSIEPYGEATFEAELQAGGDGGGGAFPTDIVVGAGLLVVAAGLAAGWIASWVHVNYGLAEDPDFQTYRLAAGNWAQNTGTVSDGTQFNVCTTAQSDDLETRALAVDGTLGIEQRIADRARDVCNEADTFEALEFVFGFGALAAGAVGLYFLVSGVMNQGSQPDEEAWQIMPSFGPEHAYVGLMRRF